MIAPLILIAILCYSSIGFTQQKDSCQKLLNSAAESSVSQQALVSYPEAKIDAKIDPAKVEKDKDALSFSTLIDLILKAVNIGLIFYIFSSGRTERREDVSRKKYYFWFQDLLVKGGKPHIDSFFNELDGLIELHTTSVAACVAKKSTTVGAYKKLVTGTHRAFNKQKRNLDKSFVSLLYVVTPELGAELDQMLIDLQDSFGEKIQTECHSYDSAALESLATNFKKDFLRKLFTWKADL